MLEMQASIPWIEGKSGTSLLYIAQAKQLQALAVSTSIRTREPFFRISHWSWFSLVRRRPVHQLFLLIGNPRLRGIRVDRDMACALNWSMLDSAPKSCQRFSCFGQVLPLRSRGAPQARVHKHIASGRIHKPQSSDFFQFWFLLQNGCRE